ncbi:MAG TPA: helix-turn-helix transcriptional regulator [Candidatus Cloacimonadota bacterium]|nr:helix-turn-helix transcriptional regulator [Candidatus Cloacimonadota bacterium]
MKSHGKVTDIQDRFDKILDLSNVKEQIEVREMILNSVIMEQIDFNLKQKGLNRSDLAKIIGVTKSYVSQLFNCNKMINLNMIAAIEKHLNLNVFVKITPPVYTTFCESGNISEKLWEQVKSDREFVKPSDLENFEKIPKQAVSFNGES